MSYKDLNIFKYQTTHVFFSSMIFALVVNAEMCVLGAGAYKFYKLSEFLCNCSKIVASSIAW